MSLITRQMQSRRIQWFATLPRKVTSFVVLMLPSCFLTVLFHTFWINIWKQGPPRGWNAAGHYANALIFTNGVFPESFGWTSAYFCGMPLPNYYPPFLYFCVAILNRILHIPFDTSFKVVIALPLLAIPSGLAAFAFQLHPDRKRAALITGLFAVAILTDPGITGSLAAPSGIDYLSVFLVGQYTQPLGFLLLLGWYYVFVKATKGFAYFAGACVLGCAVILSNIFIATTAGLLASAVLLTDWFRDEGLFKSGYSGQRIQQLGVHVASGIVSVLLSAFWLIPVLLSYDYFVTRPYPKIALNSVEVVWILASILSAILWARDHSGGDQNGQRTVRVMLVRGCLILFVSVLVGMVFAPRWLPFQAHRYSSALMLFLSIPLGHVVDKIWHRLFDKLWLRIIRPGARLAPFSEMFAVFASIVLVLWLVFSGPPRTIRTLVTALNASFYNPCSFPTQRTLSKACPDTQLREPLKVIRGHTSGKPGSFGAIPDGFDFGVESASVDVSNVLKYAAVHRDGRYLVCFPENVDLTFESLDARALSAYLGVQGNESMWGVFREASPNSLFLYAQANALSTSPEMLGISSTLSEDLNFVEQPLATHLARIRWLGGRYVVVYDDNMKERLALETSVIERQDFGAWSVFVLRDPPAPLAEPLRYLPALVVSDFTLKLRRSDEHNFVRLAEEQFADNWFEVPLVRSPEIQIDRAIDSNTPQRFGALIVERYAYDDLELAYQRLREFARTRPLLLLARDEQLFHRIRTNLSFFPHCVILDAGQSDSGVWMNSTYGPNYRFGDSVIRREWRQIRNILERNEVPVASNSTVSLLPGPERDDLTLSAVAQQNIPVLLRMSYHPRWAAARGEPLYATTPFFTLAFVHGNIQLHYRRSWSERLAIAISLLSVTGLFGLPFIIRLRARARGSDARSLSARTD